MAVELSPEVLKQVRTVFEGCASTSGRARDDPTLGTANPAVARGRHGGDVARFPLSGFRAHRPPRRGCLNHAGDTRFIPHQISQFSWPFSTELIGVPQGGDLYFIDLLGAILGALPCWLFGPAVAYNGVMIACPRRRVWRVRRSPSRCWAEAPYDGGGNGAGDALPPQRDVQRHLRGDRHPLDRLGPLGRLDGHSGTDQGTLGSPRDSRRHGHHRELLLRPRERHGARRALPRGSRSTGTGYATRRGTNGEHWPGCLGVGVAPRLARIPVDAEQRERPHRETEGVLCRNGSWITTPSILGPM